MSSTTCAPPIWRPGAGRAARAGLPPRAARQPSRAADRGAQHRRRRQRDVHWAQRSPDRLRHGPGNALLDDYMAARTGSPTTSWRRGRAAVSTRRWSISSFRTLTSRPCRRSRSTGTRSACGYRMYGRAGPRARPSVARGRRGDPRRLHGLGGGARPRALPGGAAALDRERRRPAIAR